MHPNASAERRARARIRAGRGSSSGVSTQGATAIGHTSMDVTATSLRKRGDRANSAAPRYRDHGLPTRRAPASRQKPTKATPRISDHHSRWTIQAGTPAALSRAWKGPLGKR